VFATAKAEIAEVESKGGKPQYELVGAPEEGKERLVALFGVSPPALFPCGPPLHGHWRENIKGFRAPLLAATYHVTESCCEHLN